MIDHRAAPDLTMEFPCTEHLTPIGSISTSSVRPCGIDLNLSEEEREGKEEDSSFVEGDELDVEELWFK